MSKPLSATTIALVQATVPALEAHGLAITQRMYQRLFQDPAIRDLFNQSHHGATGSQPRALAAAVLAYARNIDNLGVLAGAVERIAQKHVALTILPEHYPSVATALLGAIEDVLGAAATPEILAAWGEAYWFLADLLIGREAQIYREAAAQPGGWTGWRDFAIESVRTESDVISSFVLVPTDGGPVAAHKPGQYLGFDISLPGVGTLRRNYSISCAPNSRAYRITVKRECTTGFAPGQVSGWLHDHASPGTVLRVAPPAGDFFLDLETEKPVVLVSGGVGLTPMISMLETIAARRPDLPAWYIHGAENGRHHAMGEAVRDLSRRSPHIVHHTFYNAPLPEDRAGLDYNHVGLIPTEWLAQHTPIAEATYYLCGPKPFLRALVGGLAGQGIPAERIRYEFFGPADELLEPASPETQAA